MGYPRARHVPCYCEELGVAYAGRAASKNAFGTLSQKLCDPFHTGSARGHSSGGSHGTLQRHVRALLASFPAGGSPGGGWRTMVLLDITVVATILVASWE